MGPRQDGESLAPPRGRHPATPEAPTAPSRGPAGAHASRPPAPRSAGPGRGRCGPLWATASRLLYAPLTLASRSLPLLDALSAYALRRAGLGPHARSEVDHEPGRPGRGVVRHRRGGGVALGGGPHAVSDAPGGVDPRLRLHRPDHRGRRDGWPGPGLATAVVSALSLNFFLTEPYLSLEIDKPGDIAAFVALAACGLIAAAFGKRRVRTAEQVSRTRGDLEVLARTAASLAARAPIEDVLEDLRRFFGLGGLVLRRADERLVAAAPSSQAESPRAPDRARPLDAGRVGGPGPPTRTDRLRLPEGGGRLPLQGPGAAASSISGRETRKASASMSAGRSPSRRS